MSDQDFGDRIWVDGVLLEGVVSGDVSFVEEQIQRALEQGGGWVNVQTPTSVFYRLHVTASTSIVIRYAI